METTGNRAESIEIFAVPAIPEVSAGADLTVLVCQAMEQHDLEFCDGDNLVVAQKIVSKSEGRLVELRTVDPSPFAISVATANCKDPRVVEVVLRESSRIVRMDGSVLIVETRQGFICANAGVDSSNVPQGWVSLLPVDSDASADRLRDGVQAGTGRSVAVVITDTFGRPWREGLTNVALGVSGLAPLEDYHGQTDPHGQTLYATVVATADELAAAAGLLMGKTARQPVIVIRNYRFTAKQGKGTALIRPPEKDLFR